MHLLGKEDHVGSIPTVSSMRVWPRGFRHQSATLDTRVRISSPAPFK